MPDRIKSDGLVLSDGTVVEIIPPIADENTLGGVKADATSSGSSEYTEDVRIDENGKLKVKKTDISGKVDKTEYNALKKDLEYYIDNLVEVVEAVETSKCLTVTNKTISAKEGYSINIPKATETTLGTVKAKPIENQDGYTLKVGIDKDGNLKAEDQTKTIETEIGKLDIDDVKDRIKKLEGKIGEADFGKNEDGTNANAKKVIDTIRIDGTRVVLPTNYAFGYDCNTGNPDGVNTFETFNESYIYKRSFYVETIAKSTTTGIIGTISNIKNIVDIRGTIMSGSVVQPLPYTAGSGAANLVRCYIKKVDEGEDWNIYIQNYTSNGFSNAVITVYYTVNTTNS